MGLIGFGNKNIFNDPFKIIKQQIVIPSSNITTTPEPTPEVSEKEKSIVYSVEPDTTISPDIYRKEDKSKPVDMAINGTMNSVNTESGIISTYRLDDTIENILYEEVEALKKGDNISFIPVQSGDPIPTTIDTFENIVGMKDKSIDPVPAMESKQDNALLNQLSISSESAKNAFDNFISNGSTKDYLLIAGVIIIVVIIIRKS